MAITIVDIDNGLIRRAQKLTGLRSKQEIVNRALELLVRYETRKGILRQYGKDMWRGDFRASRKNRI